MRVSNATATGGDKIEFGDFNVIVGGNAVGKTTLLLEIYALATGTQRARWFWLDSGQPLEYDSRSPLEDARLLRGSLARRWDGSNLFYFSKAARNPEGTVDLDGKLRFDQGEVTTLEQMLAERNEEGVRDLLVSGAKYWRPFVSLATCETRLSLTGEIGVTPLNQPPENALNVLHRDRRLMHDVDDLIVGQFNNHLVLLSHTATQLQFGLGLSEPPQFDGNADNLEDEYAKIEDWKNDAFMTIADVGHGIRSMVKLVMSLQDPVSQIMLIDEPEMHIYPAQKRWLGRQLVRLASEQNKQVFMVTHDPIVLQGILDSEGQTRVFRISFGQADERTFQVCDLKHIDSVGAKRNQDSYLQALFYQRTVAVEGAADRAFYQVMIEELLGARIRDKDLGFVACGGVGQSKNMASLAAQVGLQSAFIYDFDVLTTGVNVLFDIMAIRGRTAPCVEKLKTLLKEKAMTDGQLAAEARQGPSSQLVKDNQQLFDDATEELKAAGVHIVPYGALESWAETVEQKVRFPELAPDVIAGDENLSRRLESFLATVLESVGC